MDSIIHQLQAEALDPKVGVSDLLRKAKVVAVKLDLKDFLIWIENELNGYITKIQEELPSYRMVSGETKGWNPYRGWIPVLFTDVKSQLLLSNRGVSQPIGELDDIMKSSGEGLLMMDFNPEAKNAILKAIDSQTDIKFMLGRNSVAGILDAVRNTILDWSLKLEKEGILGEGFSFSQTEREKARDPGTVYKIDYIENFAGTMGTIGGSANVQITQINSDSKEELQELLRQIRKYAPDIKLEESKRSELIKHLDKLEMEVKSKYIEPSKTKVLLSSIKNIFESAAGNVVAQGIILGIQKFIG